MKSEKLGRNDPCPCGSGKKFKACCQSKPLTFASSKPNAEQYLQRAWQAVSQQDVAGILHWFAEALKLEPDNPQALAGLGQALCWQNQTKEGLSNLRKAGAALQKQALRSKDTRFVLELAEQLHHWGDLETSLALAQLAVRLTPNDGAANNNLGLYLTRLNRNEEAVVYVRKACQLLPGNPACQNLLAILEASLGQRESAKTRFQAIIKDNRDIRQTARAWQELAGVLDKLGEFEQSFAASQQAKAMQQTFAEFNAVDKTRIFRTIERNKLGFDRELLQRWRREDFADDLPAPIFLLGFLRSGTTLTEQVLAAHPDIFTSDENNLINGLAVEVGKLSGLGEDVPTALRKIDLATACKLRQHYWRRVEEEYGAEALQKRFVDKVAMNSIDIGLISVLFPEAKILFALRDPRDVCISCHAQSFAPAPVTINLLTWEGIVRQYAAVMDLWLHLRGDIAAEYLELRYEDTVEAFEPTFRRVFQLLGLEWQEEVTQFHTLAQGRYIATPSFAAVSQPLYKTAVARWRHYEKQVDEILPVLRAYIEAFGYEA